MTGWIIGFASKANSPSEGTWRDSRLGGYAIWPTESHPEIPPCPLCNQPRLLLLQAYAPHPAHEERFLVVFACNSAVCGRDAASWVAYRGFQRREEEKKTDMNMSKATTTSENNRSKQIVEPRVNWDSSSSSSSNEVSNAGSEISLGELEAMLNDNLNISSSASNHDKKNFSQIPPAIPSMPSTAVEDANKESTLTAADAKNNNNNNKKKHFVESGRYFAPNFVEVAYEQNDRSDDDEPDAKIAALLRAYEAEEKSYSDTTDTTWCGEDDAEETDAVVANDEFRRVIERAPEQILRYKFGGVPQWPKQPPPPAVRKKKCAKCGRGENVFEVQVLGSALYFMAAERAVPRQQKEAALNFMAVAIYTCVNDCEDENININIDTPLNNEYEYQRVEVIVQPDVW